MENAKIIKTGGFTRNFSRPQLPLYLHPNTLSLGRAVGPEPMCILNLIMIGPEILHYMDCTLLLRTLNGCTSKYCPEYPR